MGQHIDQKSDTTPSVLKLTIKIPLYDITQSKDCIDKITYVDVEMKVREIIQEQDLPKNNIILYSIEVNNKETRIEGHRQFFISTTVVVYFEDEYKVLKDRINALSEGFTRMEKFLNKELTVSLPCYGQALMMQGSYLGKNPKSIFDPAIDIAIFTASPLVKWLKNQKVSTNFTQFNQTAELNRIKKHIFKNQDIIQISLYQGTKEDLFAELQNKTRILHLICNVEIIEDEVYLALESKSHIGMQDNARVEDLFGSIREFTRPDFVLLIGNKVSKAAKVLADLGYNAVVFVETSNYNEDERGHAFVQKLYNYLTKGSSVEESFNRAKLEGANIKSNQHFNCCCLHTHDNDCVFMKQAEQFGIEACHFLYHCQYLFCNCKKLINFSSSNSNCPYGKANVKAVNKNYDCTIYFDPSHKYTCQTICCCKDPNDKPLFHSQFEKVGLQFDPSKQPFIFKSAEGVIITQFITRMQREKNYDFEPLFGVNRHIYQLISGIRDENFALNIYGPKRSGRTALLRQAVRYLLNRDFAEYNKVEINFSNIQSISDCEYLIKQAMGASKVPSLEEAFTQFGNQKTVVIFDNCDYIDQHFRLWFGRTIELVNNTFIKGVELIAISEKRLSVETIGNRFWQIPVLRPEEAVNIFLHEVETIAFTDLNISSIFTNFQNYSKNSSSPLIYEKVNSICRQYKEKSQLLKVIENNITKNSKTIEPIPESFSKKMNERQSNIDSVQNKIYPFLIYLMQFQEGLTELDFTIMSKLKSFKDELKIDWEWINDVINSKLKFEEFKQWIDVSENKGYYYKAFKINNYSRLYIEQKEQAEVLLQMRMKSLHYITIYTISMIRYLFTNYHYHQSVYQFSNISDTGIFEIKKAVGYSDFFDKESFFPPKQDLDNVKITLDYLQNICKTKIGEEIIEVKSITRLILQQKENIISTYRINFESLKLLSKDKKQQFEHYYYTLLVNIATISITITGEINRLFIWYCLKKSIECSNNIVHRKKTHAMLLIKLYITKLGIDLKERNTNREKLVAEFQKDVNVIVESTWDKDSLMHLIWKTEKQFIKLYVILFMEPPGKMKVAILQSIRELQCILAKMKSYNYNALRDWKLSIRLTVMKSQFILQYTKDYYFPLFPNLKQQMNDAARRYNKFEIKVAPAFEKQKNDPFKIQLHIKIKLNSIQCEMLNKNNTIKDYQQYTQLFKDVSEVISKEKKFKISSKQILKQHESVGENLKNSLWLKTNIVFVYMRSSPLQEMNQRNNRNMLRSYSKFKTELKNMFEKSKKNVMTIFRLLTFKNLKITLNHSCLLLVLTIDCEIKNGKTFIVFENERLPTKELKEVSQLKSLFYQNEIGILLICGKNSERLCRDIKSYHPNKCPLLIAIDTLAVEDLIESQQKQSIHKHLQRVVLQKSIEYFILKFSELVVSSKIEKEQFNMQMKIIRKIAYSKMRQYISRRYDIISKFDQVRDILNPKISETMRTIDINFEDGSWSNITFETNPQHNIEDRYQNVGRLSTIVNVSKFLVGEEINDSALFSQNQYTRHTINYLNIYGVSGIGKRTLMIEVAFPFLARRMFQDGIYMIDCEQVHTDFGGHIMQYLQQNLNILLQKLNAFSSRQQTISLLLFLDNFSQIQQSANQQFFKLIEQLEVRLVVTTIRKYHKDKIMNTNLVKIEMKPFEQYQARILLYSNIDINYYAKYGDIKGVEAQLNSKNNKSYVPGDMKKEIDKFSEQHEGHIRKRDKEKEEADVMDNYDKSTFLTGSGFIGLGQSNMMVSTDIYTSNSFFNPVEIKRITKVKLVGKRITGTPTASMDAEESRSRKYSNAQEVREGQKRYQ